jgi:glycerol kinase
MNSDAHILAIDQGTTGTTAALFDQRGQVVNRAYQEFLQIYPHPGWVEHDPEAIWQTVIATVEKLCSERQRQIAAIGITNQRETTVIWEKKNGSPVYNAIVWQCRRTARDCERLKQHEGIIRQKTGLPVDAYFSGTKVKWILERLGDYSPHDLLFGTVDSWLVWKLTGGKVHATDYTNASRTLLFNIHEKRWDLELCRLLGVPPSILPEVKPSVADYGHVETIPELRGVPILGVAGDQQAALFGQLCFTKGQVKNTYGTGCFLLMNTGNDAIQSEKGLITTLAVNGEGEPCFALEGSIFIGGAAIQWLRDEIKILHSSSESEKAAQAVSDNAGVYLVPAFVGLGAPHWDMQARGMITGLTRGTNRNHIVRAALEAMAYQTHDVLSLMEKEASVRIEKLAVDGGAAANDFLLQFQADIIDKAVLRPKIIESTSLGAAFLAGLRAGVWKNSQELAQVKSTDKEFYPLMTAETREELLGGWRQALRQATTK